MTEADLGVNFFLDDSHLGKSRARGLTELLLELNPEVQGTWYPDEVGAVISSLGRLRRGTACSCASYRA